MSSLRVSVHVTGLLNRSASFASTGNSAYIPAFAPKPPPTSGAITESSLRHVVMRQRVYLLNCAAFVSHNKRLNAIIAKIAALNLVLVGAPATRWFTYRPRTTCVASASTSSAGSASVNATLFPCAGKIGSVFGQGPLLSQRLWVR